MQARGSLTSKLVPVPDGTSRSCRPSARPSPSRSAGPRPAARRAAPVGGAVEAVEDPLAVFGRDARAVVVHADHGRAVLGGDRHAHPPAVRARVVDQVHQHAAQGGAVAGDDDADVDGRALLGGRDLGEHLAEVDALGLGRLAVNARQAQQALDQPVEPLDRRGHVGQRLGALVGRHVVAAQGLDVAPQRGEGRAHLVGGVGREAPLLGEGRPQPPLGVLEPGEHAVHRPRQAAHLVGAPLGHAQRRVLAVGNPLGRRARLGQGAQGGADDEQGQAGGDQRGGQRRGGEPQGDLVERLLDVGQGPRDRDRAADPVGARLERPHEQAVVLAVEGHGPRAARVHLAGRVDLHPGAGGVGLGVGGRARGRPGRGRLGEVAPPEVGRLELVGNAVRGLRERAVQPVVGPLRDQPVGAAGEEGDGRQHGRGRREGDARPEAHASLRT